MSALKWLYYLLSSVALLKSLASARNEPVKIHLRNDSDRRVKVSYIHAQDGNRIFMIEMVEGSIRNLDTFVGHQFEIEEVGSCERERDCLTNVLTVSKFPTQSFAILEDLAVVEEVSNDNALDIEGKPFGDHLPKCRERAVKLLEAIPPNDEKATDQVLKEFNECLKNGLGPAIRRGRDEIRFERKVRETVSVAMENFTCSDPELGSTPNLEQRYWTSEKDNMTRLVHVKLDRPASRIHVIENFAHPEECDAMEETAKSQLKLATTADGKGGTHHSEHRKAMQAGITPQWSKEAEGDLIARLSRRVYDYTNFELGLNIEEHGQERLMSIQYFGRGHNDTTPDRYQPHCDGSCEGHPHTSGSRMATMVIYCEIPARGGHTNFQNANVHVKPEVGSAIFFSYMDPDTKLTDKALTQHSGCPVYEGEKKIITQWVRFGVDKEKPHHAFNTLGVLIAENGE